MKDNFFEAKNCQRCRTELTVRIMSWFTNETICLDCSAKEDDLKKKLEKKGISTFDLEGCGYIPEG